MLNALMVLTLIGLVDGIPLNEINTSVLFLNPKKLPEFKLLMYIVSRVLDETPENVRAFGKKKREHLRDCQAAQALRNPSPKHKRVHFVHVCVSDKY